MSKRLACLIFCLGPMLAWAPVGIIHAQLKAGTRFEKEIKISEDGFTIISLKENGLAMIRDRNKYESGKRNWEVTLLDNNLNETWSGDIALLPRFNLIGFDAPGDEFIYFLYREGDVELGDLMLTRFNQKSKEIDQFKIEHEFNLRLTHFSVLSNSALFGGYVGQEPAVLLFDISNQNMKVLPGFFLKETELLDLKTNRNNTFNALLMERKGGDHRNLVIKTFDDSGVQLLEDQMEVSSDKTILTGITSRLQREELLIFGTYGISNSKQATGVYAVNVDPFSKQEITFTELTRLEHFLDYMKPKRASRVRAKSERRLEAGKSPIYKIYMQPVQLRETPEGFILLAEAYNSSGDLNRPYWNNSYSPYRGYGYAPYGYAPFTNRYYNSPYSYNNTPTKSNDVEMVQSMVAFFNPSGELLWDHSLKLDGIKLPGLEQSSDFINFSDKVQLAYKDEQNLFVRTSLPKLDSIRKDTLKIPLKNAEDVVRYESNEDAGIRYWYDNSFYVWGYQSIRDRARREEDPIRYVFYLVKVESR